MLGNQNGRHPSDAGTKRFDGLRHASEQNRVGIRVRAALTLTMVLAALLKQPPPRQNW